MCHFQIPALDVKIISLHPVETRPVRNQLLEISEGFAGDSTGAIKICFWEEALKTITLGKSYHITNLTTRNFDGKVSLSTTKDIQIDIIADINLSNTDLTQDISNDEDTLTTKQLTISGVLIKRSFKCPHCKYLQKEFDLSKSTSRCINCRLLQKNNACSVNNRSTLTGDDGTKFSLSSGILQHYLRGRDLLNR